MTELEQYVYSYFGVAVEDMSVIASLFKPAVLSKGDYYLKKGTSCDKLSFIQSGFLASLTFNTPSRQKYQAEVSQNANNRRTF